MLIKRADLDGIEAGTIRLAFRRWKRPTVKTGGRLRTARGELEIRAVDRVTLSAISEAEARQAGFAGRKELLQQLRRQGGDVYRIRFGELKPDPRIALRQKASLSADERWELEERLDRIDGRSASGPWTREFLRLIADRPSVRAEELAAKLGVEKAWFKRKVRRLKELGLTESLSPGYRLSPRGKALLARRRR